MTEAAQQAMSILRDGSHFSWYVIPLFAFVVYVYANEIERRNWNLVLAGLAFWGMDWFNEIWNSIFFHLNGRAPMWGAPGDTAYLIMIGLNIEIMFMFAIAGIAFCKMLPADPKMKILGVPNRIFLALANSIFCVIVEIWLNSVNALTWDWSFWNTGAPWLIIVFGYLHLLPRVLLGLRYEDHAFETHHRRRHLGRRRGGGPRLRRRSRVAVTRGSRMLPLSLVSGAGHGNGNARRIRQGQRDPRPPSVLLSSSQCRTCSRKHSWSVRAVLSAPDFASWFRAGSINSCPTRASRGGPSWSTWSGAFFSVCWAGSPRFAACSRPTTRLFLFIGVLGGFTTFSTLAFETVALAEGSQMLRAAANVAAHVILGLGAAWLGFNGARLL